MWHFRSMPVNLSLVFNDVSQDTMNVNAKMFLKTK